MRCAVTEDTFRLADGTFDEWSYLFHNPDVASAVRNGQHESGYEHFLGFGMDEYRQGLRSPPPSLREMSYKLRNPDIAMPALEHWRAFGRDEERAGLRRGYISGASTDVSEFDLSTWSDGYVVIPGLFSAEQCDSVIRYTRRLWENRRSNEQPIDVDIYLNNADCRKVALREAPDDAIGQPMKINNLYSFSPEVRSMMLDERLCRILRHFLEGDPVALTSLNFAKGSEQGLHLDTFYMPPALPHRMVAAWVALEDVHDDNGPLSYIPGSNRIPPYFFDGHRLRIDNSIKEYTEFSNYYYRQLEKRQLQVKHLKAKKGDVLIWHALLYHGGAPIKDPNITRHSVVAH